MYLLESDFRLYIYITKSFLAAASDIQYKKKKRLYYLFLSYSYWLHIWPVLSEILWGYNLYTLTQTSLIRRLFIRFSLSHSIHAAGDYERAIALVAASIVFFELGHFDFPVVSFPNGSVWVVAPTFDFFSADTAFHNYRFLRFFLTIILYHK